MKILHYYHDIMNLYGDYANVLALQDMLTRAGEEVVIEKKTIGDPVQLSDYAFIYIGSGTERNQKVVLEDLRLHSDELREYIESGKPVLMTGNSFEMLGKMLTDCSGKTYQGLGLMNFTTTEQNKTRNTADAIFSVDFLERPLVGFINKCSTISGVVSPLFKVKMGLGNQADDQHEGVRMKNLFGTHLTGPVLMKNPEFLTYITSLLTENVPEVNPLQQNGYEITLKELTIRMNEGE